MQLDGLKLETGETIEINGKKYTKVTSNFLRTDNQKLYFYYDQKKRNVYRLLSSVLSRVQSRRGLSHLQVGCRSLPLPGGRAP